jgi:hypothetical protein
VVRMNSRSVFLALVLAASSLSACRCQSDATGSSRAPMSEEALKTASRALAQHLGDALMAENYDAAYELTSAEYRSRLSKEAFEKQARSARAQYGKALKVETDNGMIGNEFFRKPEAVQDYGFSATIPPESRMAWVFSTMALELDEQREIERCYQAASLVVEEEGKLRLGHVEYMWCD